MRLPRLALLAIGAAALLPATFACSGDEEPAAAGACGETGSLDEAPEDLACTGLYTDITTKAIAPSARAFAPAVAFWSDGLDKDRFIALPDGTTIDATSADDWRFPVGTKAWKEIKKGPKKIETRFFMKVKDDKWLQAAYVWSDDGLKATRADGKDITVDGAPYHIPSSSECNDCHRGRKERLLGFEAISLSQPSATGVTLTQLVNEKRIAPLPARTTTTLPDPAFGVLHVNCGVTCHNDSAASTANATGLRFRLGFDEVATKPPAAWQVMTTNVGVEAKSPGWEGELRIKPGVPEESLIVKVMKQRGAGQMPPIATNVVDAQGVSAIEAWVRAMPH